MVLTNSPFLTPQPNKSTCSMRVNPIDNSQRGHKNINPVILDIRDGRHMSIVDVFIAVLCCTELLRQYKTIHVI